MMMMPRRGRAQTAYFFEELPFSETEQDLIRLNPFSETPAPVLWPGNLYEPLSQHPQFYNVNDVFELIQRGKPARHPLTRREPVHVDELHPILYPDADVERYINTVKLLNERLKDGAERNALFHEVWRDMEAYLKHHSNISSDRQAEIAQSLKRVFENSSSRVFKRGRDHSSLEAEEHAASLRDEELEADEEDESSSDEGSRIEQNIITMSRRVSGMQIVLREDCIRLRKDPRVYVWRRDACLLEQPSIFDLCDPGFLWYRRSIFKESMSNSYELRVQPRGYANGYADCERDYQQANLLADRFATLRAILYPTGTYNWNMPFLQGKTIKVFKNLFTDLSRRNVNLSPSLHMSARNGILSPETIRRILKKRFFTNLSGSLIRDGGPRYYIVNPLKPFELISVVSRRLNEADRNRLRRRWRNSVEVATILLTIAKRVIPAFVTMTAEQICHDINARHLFRHHRRTDRYKLKSEERLEQQGEEFSDFEGQSLLQLMHNQEQMIDEHTITLDLRQYWENVRNI